VNFQHLITVENGLLYTVSPTTAIFEIRSQEGGQQMAPRPVARLVGLNIFLDDNQKGILEIDGQAPIEFSKDGSPRTLRFNNECDVTYFPASPNYKMRNDFYMDYEEIIDTSVNEVNENFLMVVAQKEPNLTSNFFGFAALDDGDGGDDGSDDGKNTSPCTVRAYGNTDGWGV
jgi:hypothetical protein